jgi:hypothetical protein
MKREALQKLNRTANEGKGLVLVQASQQIGVLVQFCDSQGSKCDDETDGQLENGLESEDQSMSGRSAAW